MLRIIASRVSSNHLSSHARSRTLSAAHGSKIAKKNFASSGQYFSFASIIILPNRTRISLQAYQSPSLIGKTLYDLKVCNNNL